MVYNLGIYFQSIGEKVYTIPEVIEEIKDKATKQRLQVLPYELIYREPAPEAIKAGTVATLNVWT